MEFIAGAGPLPPPWDGFVVLTFVLVVAAVVCAWVAYRRLRPRARLDATARLLLRASDQAILLLDNRAAVIEANAAAAKLLQLPATGLAGRRAQALFDSRFTPARLRKWTANDSGGGHSIQALYTAPPPGGERYLQTVWYAQRRGRRASGYLCLLQQAGSRARGAGARASDAARDALTELPARGRFLRRLERAVIQMYEHRDRAGCTVILLNADRFRKVNDHLGPSLADQVLVAVAERLRHVVRDGFLARLEGDQFGILIEGEVRQRKITQFVDALKASVERPIGIHNHEVRLTMSLGVVANAAGYQRAADLLRDARIALARAKSKGLGQHQFFHNDLRSYAVRRARLEADLRGALENRELRAVYQPIVDVRRCRVLGFEALLRWRHPEHGEVSPAEFIEIAEDSERIVPIGRQVRTASCTRLAEWQRACRDSSLYLSFNLTDSEIRHPKLPIELGDYLRKHGMSASNVRIELVERMFMHDGSREALERLFRLGLPLYIDDFGTGYSSFSRLYESPVHSIKIDRSFVREMGRSEQGRKIVTAIAGLAHSLGVEMIAEGVERRSELAQLQALGCRRIQGFLFSRPVEADAVPGLLRDQGWIKARMRKTAAARGAGRRPSRVG